LTWLDLSVSVYVYVYFSGNFKETAIALPHIFPSSTNYKNTLCQLNAMKVTLYLPTRLYIEAKKHDLKLSRMLQDSLVDYFHRNGIDIEQDKSSVLLLVRCPHCGGQFATSSVIAATCRYCHTHFAIFPRSKPSRVVKILQGTKEDIARLRGVPVWPQENQ